MSDKITIKETGQLLTLKEVAAKLNVKEKTIRNWVSRNWIAFVKLPGGDLRFREENLENWIDQRTVKPVRA